MGFSLETSLTTRAKKIGQIRSVATPPVPFEEDENDASIWFLDHSYLEKMSVIFRRISGAYPTHPGDQIVTLFRPTHPANSSAETHHLF